MELSGPRKEILTMAAISLLSAGMIQLMFPWEALWGDELQYIRYSEKPFISGTGPWASRLLTPLTASIIPLRIDWVYRSITLLSTAGILTGVFLIARRLGCSLILSSTVWLLYLLHPQCRYLAHHCALVDPATTFCIVLISYAILFNKEKLLSTALLLGILNHESVLWMIPVVIAAYTINRFQKSSAIRAIIISFPALIAFCLTRFIYPMFNDQAVKDQLIRDHFPFFHSTPHFADYFIQYILSRPPAEGHWTELFSGNAISGGAAILLPAALVGFYFSSRRAKSLLIFWEILTFITVLIQARPQMLYVGFPVVTIYMAFLFQRMSLYSIHVQGLIAGIFTLSMILCPQSWIAGFMLMTVCIGVVRFYSVQSVERAHVPKEVFSNPPADTYTK